MRAKLTFLLFLLIWALVFSPSAVASVDVLQTRNGDVYQGYHASADSYSNPSIGKSIESKQFQSTSTFPLSKEPDTQIRRTQDATMSASTIEASDSFFSVIETFSFKASESYSPAIFSANQTVLFNILFRLIISPNAP